MPPICRWRCYQQQNFQRECYPYIFGVVTTRMIPSTSVTLYPYCCNHLHNSKHQCYPYTPSVVTTSRILSTSATRIHLVLQPLAQFQAPVPPVYSWCCNQQQNIKHQYHSFFPGVEAVFSQYHLYISGVVSNSRILSTSATRTVLVL